LDEPHWTHWTLTIENQPKRFFNRQSKKETVIPETGSEGEEREDVGGEEEVDSEVEGTIIE
jgi:hypothetical protein